MEELFLNLIPSFVSKGLSLDLAWLNFENFKLESEYNYELMQRYYSDYGFGGIRSSIDAYKEAGFNPFSLAGLSFNPVQGPQSGNLAPTNMASFFDAAMNSTFNPTVAEYINSQTRLNNANADFIENKTDQEKEGWEYTLNMLKNQSDISDVESKIAKLFSGHAEEFVNLNLDNLREGVNKTKAEIAKLKEEKEKVSKEIDKMSEEIKLIQTEEDKIKAMTALLEKQKIAQEYDNRIKAVEAELKEQFGITLDSPEDKLWNEAMNGDDGIIEGAVKLLERMENAKETGVQNAQSKTDFNKYINKNLIENINDAQEVKRKAIERKKKLIATMKANGARFNSYGSCENLKDLPPAVQKMHQEMLDCVHDINAANDWIDKNVSKGHIRNMNPIKK